MKRRVLGAVLGVLVAVSTASAGPKTVITVDGVAAATRISATYRDAVAAKIVSLNAHLEKIRDAKPTKTQLTDIHDECLALHDMIVKQMDDEQRHAFAQYLHAQMKAAGIDVDAMAKNHHEHHAHNEHN